MAQPEPGTDRSLNRRRTLFFLFLLNSMAFFDMLYCRTSAVVLGLPCIVDYRAAAASTLLMVDCFLFSALSSLCDLTLSGLRQVRFLAKIARVALFAGDGHEFVRAHIVVVGKIIAFFKHSLTCVTSTGHRSSAKRERKLEK